MLKFFRKTCIYVLAAPLLCVLLGTVSNEAVLYANHDTFPVNANAAKVHHFTGQTISELPALSDGTVMIDDTHCVASNKTHLNLLADVIDEGSDGIESIGDILIDLGNWAWRYCVAIWGFIVTWKLWRTEE